MFSSDQYETLDFGNGRKLERFGDLILDRPCPAAENLKIATSSLWSKADAVFQMNESVEKNRNTLGDRGFWNPKSKRGQEIFGSQTDSSGNNSRPWQARHDKTIFELCGTPFGHVGLFPEQAENWDTINAFCRQISQISQTLYFRVLNLFAYTGGSTLAAASGGATVTHVDAAKNVVHWARKNAELSQIPQTSVRWIAEDATKFVRRELKRGNQYHGVILDPPSYGHGTHGEVWRLSKQLPDLLFDCFSLLDPAGPCFLLLTCHTPGFSLNRLTKLVESSARDAWGERFSRTHMTIRPQTMALRSQSGAILPSGESVMFCYNDK